MIRFIIICLILGCSNTFASTIYEKEIENYAASLISFKYKALHQQSKKETLQINILPLDKRDTYLRCPVDLIGNILNDEIKKRTTVKVTCPVESGNGWTAYIHARVTELVPTIVTSQALSKGQILELSNIKSIYVDKIKVRNGSFSEKSSLIGTRLKRNLSTDKIIKYKDICFVCKGDKVTIKAIKKGLSIKASGIALNDANIGKTVRVKNLQSQRVIVGTVSALKEVRVSF